jgi:hypothetical protein
MFQALASRDKRRYASKIIKAGALLPDTQTLLSLWNLSQTKARNMDRFRTQNLLGKATRARTEDILAIFNQRFLKDEAVLRSLVYLTRNGLSAAALNQILYFHACQADILLHDVVVQILFEVRSRGREDVSPQEIQQILGEWVAQGKSTSDWSAYTFQRVIQGLLSTLRDFGILTGAVRKSFAATFLPLPAFAYIAFYLSQRLRSGRLLLQSEEWKLFLLSRTAVEGLFLEAHQRRLLEYHAAGSVIRIDFPVKSLEEYAHVIVERPH